MRLWLWMQRTRKRNRSHKPKAQTLTSTDPNYKSQSGRRNSHPCHVDVNDAIISEIDGVVRHGGIAQPGNLSRALETPLLFWMAFNVALNRRGFSPW
jgi:hypothetical protein